MKCIKELFGLLPDGREVFKYTLYGEGGLEASFINYGATITSLKVPFKAGKTDVVLGFESIQDYEKSFNLPSPPYFGSVIGRYAGRIHKGIFSLNGKDYQLNTGADGNTLHGGKFGFGRVFWEAIVIDESLPAITFRYNSPDGDEYFPGNLTVKVTYSISADNALAIDYFAESDADTVVNLTNHSYFNLDGHKESVSGLKVKINADEILEIDAAGIPTGNYIPVTGTSFDFNEKQNCPLNIDNSFIVNKEIATALYSEKTGLKMTVKTNQPSVHVYVGGNCFGEIKGKENAQYHKTSGICFEAQKFPDSPNKPQFPDTILKKGEAYKHRTQYKFEEAE